MVRPRAEHLPATAPPAVRQRATSMKHADPRRGFWHNAVSATKGLFVPPRPTPEASTSVPPDAHTRRKVARRSVSVPALKEKASGSKPRRAEPPSNSSFFPSHPLSASPRRAKAAPSVARPVISNPSFPQHLDSHDIPSHSKLAYPLSPPLPSPMGATFQYRPAFIQSTSKLSTNPSVSEDDVPGMGTDSSDYLDPRPARRRTKSAPGVRFGQFPHFSPGLPDTRESADAGSAEQYSPVVIDIASPSTDSLPSPILETPKLGYEDRVPSPVMQACSPRSLTSVKRKPVPRYLYTEPPAHNPSAPCSPLLTPVPGTPPAASSASDIVRPLHAPLLSDAELILKQCRPSKLDLTLLPIGQGRSSSATRGQHRRSFSEQGSGQGSGLSTPASALPSPWYTTNVRGSRTPLITPNQELPPSASEDDLPTARRIQSSPPSTPPRVSREHTSVSDDQSSFSTSMQSQALSPLTDEEILAIRNFIHRHATGHRARQRRRNSNIRKCSSDHHSSRAPSISASYDNMKILESYMDSTPDFPLGESEDDEDAESHLPMSGSEVETKSISSSFGNLGPLEDCDADTVSGQDEVETPIEQANRGTFGYYNAPMVQSRRYRRGTPAIFAYEYVPSDSETEALVGQQSWREASGDFGDASAIYETFGKQENEISAFDDSDHICSGAEDNCSTAENARPCSSLYYRSSSDYTPQVDEHFAELRTSREPLVPQALHSDSESDRPLSTSSASASLAGSTSSGSAGALGIGLAIIPPEQFAYFDTFAYSPPRQTAMDDDCTDDSPTTLACGSPERQARNSIDAEGLDEDLSGPSDRLQSGLAKVQAHLMDRSLRSRGNSPPALKPALQIRAYPASAVSKPLPSPADSVSTYPPVTHIPMKMNAWKSMEGQGASLSADEAPVRYHNENAVPSFMHITPEQPAPKQKRNRLRSLFSRTNLRSVSGRKATTAAE